MIPPLAKSPLSYSNSPDGKPPVMAYRLPEEFAEICQSRWRALGHKDAEVWLVEDKYGRPCLRSNLIDGLPPSLRNAPRPLRIQQNSASPINVVADPWSRFPTKIERTQRPINPVYAASNGWHVSP